MTETEEIVTYVADWLRNIEKDGIWELFHKTDGATWVEEMVNSNPPLFPGTPPLDEDLHREELEICAWMAYIRFNRVGDEEVINFLRRLARDHIKYGHRLPPTLQRFVLDDMTSSEYWQKKNREKNIRARRRREIRRRDLSMALAVCGLVGRGYTRTRNAATDANESACSIVAQALSKLGKGVGEDAVHKATASIKFDPSSPLGALFKPPVPLEP